MRKIEKKIRAAVLFSGGKDSCLALFKARELGLDLRYLLSIVPENEDSFMFHKPNIDVIKKQAEMLSISLIIQKSKGEKDKELKDLETLIKKVKGKVDALVIGGIASNYQGIRIKKIAEGIGLKVLVPLWDYTPEKVWKELIENKFEVVITKISCEGLSKKFIGKLIRNKEYKEISGLGKKYGFRTDFEGGEAETLILWMPGFKKSIKLIFDSVSEGEHRHFMLIKNISI